MDAQQQDWERQRQWCEDRDRRFAERVAEQERLHADESFTAGWEQEEDA